MSTEQTTIAAGTAVRTPKGKGTVTEFARGWYSIQTESGTTIKARAKDTTVEGALKDGYVKHGVAVYRPADYTKHKTVKTKCGRPVYDVSDEAAGILRGLDLDEQYRKAAEVLGCTQKELRERYKDLNPGMQRMNLGNRMRAKLAEAAK